MAGGFSGLFPSVMECRKREYEKLKEQAKGAFTKPQEMRILQLVREELNNPEHKDWQEREFEAYEEFLKEEGKEKAEDECDE
jgi:hypothetical protein